MGPVILFNNPIDFHQFIIRWTACNDKWKSRHRSSKFDSELINESDTAKYVLDLFILTYTRLNSQGKRMEKFSV